MTTIHIREAVLAARAVSANIPLVAQLTFTQDGRTLLGHTPQKVAEQLTGLPIWKLDVYGCAAYILWVRVP